ncbi:MAG TPA: P27 family phage terminase small subunit [Planctomicrobium sp.]|nr:P27 family phage terminase small subunit [Planctomicrobium sp.]
MRLDRDNPPQKIPLPDDARQLWPYLVDEICERGFSERVPPHRLAIYCQLFAQYQRVTRKINQINEGEDGQIKKTMSKFGESEDISAAALQQGKLLQLLKSFDKEFGFLEERIEEDGFEAIRKKVDARMAQSAGKNGK